MLASASAFNAYVGIAVDVVCFFMALLSFRGISTPSLKAQGEQRRSSLFNIPRDIAGQSEPHVARMGELLPSRNRQQSVSGARRLHSGAVAPVVALQAQSQATRGRELSTLAPLRALRARK